MITELPPTMSGILRIALDDMKKCAGDPNYRLDMSQWHQPVGFNKIFAGDKCGRYNLGDGLCRICMAGAVMAQTLNCPIDGFRSPASFRDEDNMLADQLLAIDELRTGCFVGVSMYLCLGLSHETIQGLTKFYLENDIPAGYGPDFFEKWELMYNKLEELGL